MVRTLRWAVLPVLFIGGCSLSDPVAAPTGPTGAPTTVVATAPVADAATATPTPPDPSPGPTSTPEPSEVPTTEVSANPFLGSIQPLAPARVGDAAFGALPAPDRQPVGIRIDDLNIDSAPVTDVGVNPDQTFEVPAAEEVGWYKFGPTPGAEGSAVLAAHIAFDGVDGVFRNLADLQPGAVIDVIYDDGSTQSFRVEQVTDYNKQELPDSLFAKDGRAQLALITCGGTFNRELRSYESNTVAVAIPVT